MTNNRTSISVQYNKWHNAQRVDRDDLKTEQDRNVQIDAGIVNNHFGSGVLPDSIEQKVLFDSDILTAEQAALVVSNDFDGTGIEPTEQPTDTTLGEQLEVELTGAEVSGRFSVKVLIIGLDFENVPQFDRFEFYKNEKQLTKKHYSQILGIFFNDFKGNNNCSRSRGGRVVIREAQSYQLSRDSVMVAQDVEPNIFFRDFKTSGLNSSLASTLQSGIGNEFSVDSLNIQTTVKQNRVLSASDVTTKIGQKFKATTDNIQKITLLLGAQRDESASVADRFNWSGDLVISIYELQTSVSCPTDIVPELAIEFDPKSEPVAQLSLDMQDFRERGYVLTDVLQPVDFVFSDTIIGSAGNNKIVPGRFYLVSVNRSGSAGTGSLFTGVGNSRISDSRLTIYNTSWVDVPEEDLWFRVHHAAAKVADGQAYDSGNGIEIEKTEVNNLGATTDYVLDAQSFADTGEKVLNTGVVQATTDSFQEEQDERTGNTVNSRQKFIPSFSFVTSSGLNDLKETSLPLIIGCAHDVNPKQNVVLIKNQTLPGLVRDDVFTVVNPDPDLLSNTLVGSKLIPNTDNAAVDYKITKVLLCTDGYGDVNGDGTIDSDDITRASALVGESLSQNSTQTKIVNGEIDTLELIRADVDGDGYVTSSDVTLITQFVTRDINSFPVGTSFTHLELHVQQSIGRFDGYHDCTDGYVRVDGRGTNTVLASTLTDEEKEYFGFTETPDINGTDAVFNAVPFADVEYQIDPLPWWQDYLLNFSSDARTVPAAFTFEDSVETFSNTDSSTCENRSNIEPVCESGRNDLMVPDNLIIKNGQILESDGTHHQIDFEVKHIILELPEVAFQESIIDVFSKLVADAGDGKTSAGLEPAVFADGSTVKSDGLSKNQVKFGVSLQAVNMNIDGYTEEDGYGIIIDPDAGIHIDQNTGLLTLTLQDLEVDPIFKTLVTKIEITLYLKKGGWNNETLTIPQEQIEGLLT